jgi:hypothetical protein
MQHPPVAVKCNGATPIFDGDGVDSLRPSIPGVGSSHIGREAAHMWLAIVSAYSVADHAWRESTRPKYFDFFTDEVLARAQIPSLGFIGKSGNYGKMSPLGHCDMVPTNEMGFLDLAMIAMKKNVYDGADETRADRLRAILTNQVYGYTIPELVFARGTVANSPAWHNARFRVPIAHENSHNTIFNDWTEVPAACQTDSNNHGSSFGEFLYGFQQVREWTGDPFLSQIVSEKMNHSSPASLLAKMQSVSFNNLQKGIFTALLACSQRGRC